MNDLLSYSYTSIYNNIIYAEYLMHIHSKFKVYSIAGEKNDCEF